MNKTRSPHDAMKRLIVLLGPTGVGKTGVGVTLSEYLGVPVISADSRQFFREMKIGTAPPSDEELSRAPHYLIHNRSVTQDYNAGAYAADASRLIDELFTVHDNLLLVGGSGMYIDAVCDGFDPLPDVPAELRGELSARSRSEGLDSLLSELRKLDPVYYEQVDRSNRARVIRALEVCITAGAPYSSLRRGGGSGRRDYRIVKIGLELPREELYDRINRRVDAMMAAGLLEEAHLLYPLRERTALQTVGYSELFDHFEGITTLDEAVELIKRNSRRYAKRQMTWFRRDGSTVWFSPVDINRIKEYLDEHN